MKTIGTYIAAGLLVASSMSGALAADTEPAAQAPHRAKPAISAPLPPEQQEAAKKARADYAQAKKQARAEYKKAVAEAKANRKKALADAKAAHDKAIQEITESKK